MSMTNRATSLPCTLVLLLALVFPGRNCSAGDPAVTISNDRLRVTLATPSGLLAVDDLHSGVHWVQYVPSRVARGREWGNVRTRDISTGELVQIEQAAAHGTRIRAQAVWRGHPFHVVFELDTEDPVLTVAIDTLDRENSSITTRSTARDAGLRPKWTVVSEIKGS